MKKQIELIKNIIDDFEKVKTEKFMNYFYDFINFFNTYFENQAIEYIKELQTVNKAKDNKIHEKIIEKLSAIILLGQIEQEQKSRVELKNIGLSLDIGISNEFALDYAKKRAGEFISEIDDTTREEIGKIIEYGLSKGNTLKEIAKKIDEKFLKYSTYRSSLIAVMEVGNAYEFGSRKQHDEYTKHFDVVGYKRTITQGDSNARATHIINEEAGWIPKNELFPGTNTDHAPHGFNCRCYTDYSIVNPESGVVE